LTQEELLLLGERLRSRRNALGFTQEFVSEKAGISVRFYQMLERGEKKLSLETLIQLSKALTISTDYLLFGGFSYTLESPLVEILNSLAPPQREDAFTILKLYAKAYQK